MRPSFCYKNFSLKHPQKIFMNFHTTTAASSWVEHQQMIVRERIFDPKLNFDGPFIDVIIALSYFAPCERVAISHCCDGIRWSIIQHFGLFTRRIIGPQNANRYSPVFTWYFKVVAQSTINCCSGTGWSAISKSSSFFMSSGWWKSKIFSFRSLQALT